MFSLDQAQSKIEICKTYCNISIHNYNHKQIVATYQGVNKEKYMFHAKHLDIG
jgi:hypothetical protein